MRRGVFVNYRRDDTGWAANLLADALRRRLGPDRVFLDNSSIALGAAFAKEIEDAVLRSATLLALIGPHWDTARLHDPQDWVRRELLLAESAARDHPGPGGPTVAAARGGAAAGAAVRQGLQHGELRRDHPTDVDALADRITTERRAPAPADDGVEPTRPALEEFLRFLLPPAQQWSGNRDRLVNLALAVLGRDDRLVFLAPARIDDGPRGSATVLVTATDVLVVEVGEDFLITGEIRFPRGVVQRVEVVPTLFLFADAVVHTTAGDRVRLQGLFRDQAGQLADHLRPSIRTPPAPPPAPAPRRGPSAGPSTPPRAGSGCSRRAGRGGGAPRPSSPP